MKLLATLIFTCNFLFGCVYYPVYIPSRGEIITVTRGEAKKMVEAGDPIIYPKANKGAIFFHYQRGIKW